MNKIDKINVYFVYKTFLFKNIFLTDLRFWRKDITKTSLNFESTKSYL